MKNPRAHFLILILVLMSLAGCISPKSYVDPSYSNTTYDDIKRRAEPLKWITTVEFRRQGNPYPRVDADLHQEVDQILRASGMAVPVTDSTGTTLNVVVNNFGDIGEAVAKGFGTGLTFGLVGSTVTD
jgi:hypothetical protein